VSGLYDLKIESESRDILPYSRAKFQVHKQATVYIDAIVTPAAGILMSVESGDQRIPDVPVEITSIRLGRAACLVRFEKREHVSGAVVFRGSARPVVLTCGASTLLTMQLAIRSGDRIDVNANFSFQLGDSSRDWSCSTTELSEYSQKLFFGKIYLYFQRGVGPCHEGVPYVPAGLD
jgi:hypothetical protein